MQQKWRAFQVLGAIYLLTAAAFATPPCGKNLAKSARYVVIVDGFSSGNLLAPAIKAYGYTPIHLLSSADMPANALASLNWNDFDKKLRFTHRNDEATLEALKEFPIDYVIPGSEAGVLLADRLSEKLGVQTNGTRLSPARRNKYLMAETMRAAGVRAVRQFQSTSLEEILRRAPEMGKVVVMKPVASAGTQGVFFTHNDEERRQAFREIMGDGTPGTNAYGEPNESVLVQELLDGPEYMVDLMTLNGEMIVTDAAIYQKTEANGSPAVYLGAKFVSYEEIDALGIVEYLREVQKALGIFNGPGHAEVKIVERDGKKVPVLVEIGARMAGGGMPVLARKACGSSQVETWMETLFAPDKFRERLKAPYRLRGGRMVCLIARKSGTLAAMPYRERIEQLPSFSRWKMRIHPGDPLPLTTNFLDYPGHIELVHADEDQIVRDMEQIRAWEAEPDFYMLAP